MKLTLFIGLFLMSFSFAIAQQQAAIWYFGKNAGLDFRSGSPVTLSDGQLSTNEGCSTISDNGGNLLFYSDGITVWNKDHKMMANGEGLMGDISSSQSAIIIPKPSSPYIYYIFTISAKDGLHFSEVDMQRNGGLGAVTNNKNFLLFDATTEKVTAVQHANGDDIWVITHEANSDGFQSYLVSNTGVNTSPVRSNVGINLENRPPYKLLGYLKASPDGRKLGIAHWKVGVELLDFDTSTGRVSNPLTLTTRNASHYGVEFSQSGEVFYRTHEKGDVFQYDLLADDILASEKLIYSSPDNFIAALQLAINGKIYVSNKRKTLDVINEPNIIGEGCNYQIDAVSLARGKSEWGLPPFIQSYFYIGGIVAENFCQNGSTSFLVEGVEPPNSITWDFGDGSTATGTNPVHTYDTPGEYTVRAIVRKGGITLTKTKTIVIYETPVAQEVEDIPMCSNEDSYTMDLSDLETQVLGALSKEDFQVSFHSSSTNAENDIDPLPTSFSSSRTEEEFFVRVHNKENTGCFDIKSFKILFNKMPVLREIEDVTVCGGKDNTYTLDLLEKSAEVLTGQNPEEFAVSWFETNEDVEDNNNPLPSLYTSTSPVQELFFRIYNIATPECYQRGSFQLEIIEGVIAHTPEDYVACENNSDGFYEFDLLTKNAEILGGQNPTAYQITYHQSAADAGEGRNALPFTYINTTAFNQPVFARVENKQNVKCFDVTSFSLKVTDTPVTREIQKWEVCDDDGIHNFDLTEKHSEILGNQNAGDYIISQYLSAEDAENDINALPTTWQNSVSTHQIFYRLENRINPGCFVTGNYFIEVNVSPVANLANPIAVCDTEETGTYTFDLSTKDPEVLGDQNREVYTVSYYNTENNAVKAQNQINKKNYTFSSPEEIIYARVDSKLAESCYEISSFPVFLNKIPQPDLLSQYIICPDAGALELDGGNYDSWQWTSESGDVVSTARYFNVSIPGIYTLTVSETKNALACENSVGFEVQSTQTASDFTFVTEHFSRENKVVITVEEPGIYEYSLDGRDFRENNIFYVSPGIYTAYVRDVSGCRTLEQQVEVMGKMEFFTPNGDGYNDNWKLTGMGSKRDYVVYIFDRYGKLLKQLMPGNNGWDGTFNGRPMPTEDYWFAVEMTDGMKYKGNFTLKR